MSAPPGETDGVEPPVNPPAHPTASTEVLVAHQAHTDGRAFPAADEGIQAPIHRLPVELLLAIFEHLIAPEGAPASLLLSHVCQSWRRLLPATPDVWRNTGTIFLNCDDEEARSKVLALLALYADRSHGLTHTKVVHSLRSRPAGFAITEQLLLSRMQDFSKALQLIGRSGATLLSISIADTDRDSSYWLCPPQGRRTSLTPPVIVAIHGAISSLLRLVGRAENLLEVYLDIASPHGMPFDVNVIARPRRIELHGPQLSCNCMSGASTLEALRHFVDELSENVLHFRYHARVSRAGPGGSFEKGQTICRAATFAWKRKICPHSKR